MGFGTIYCRQCGEEQYLHLSDLDKRCDTCKKDYPATDEYKEFLLREWQVHCDRIKFTAEYPPPK